MNPRTSSANDGVLDGGTHDHETQGGWWVEGSVQAAPIG